MRKKTNGVEFIFTTCCDIVDAFSAGQMPMRSVHPFRKMQFPLCMQYLRIEHLDEEQTESILKDYNVTELLLSDATTRIYRHDIQPLHPRAHELCSYVEPASYPETKHEVCHAFFDERLALSSFE
jgi:hypothetical protein